jgi:hypothetical protein
MPLQVLNIRSPYNVFSYTKSGTAYSVTVQEGSYFIDDLLTALTSELDGQGTSVTFGVNAVTLKITATVGNLASITINTSPLAKSLGFTGGQSGASITSTNSYFISLDTFIGIQLRNLQSNFVGKGPAIHYKIPLSVDTSYVMLHYENSSYAQFCEVNGAQLSYLDIRVVDSQGNTFPLQGVDWSMTLRIDS